MIIRRIRPSWRQSRADLWAFFEEMARTFAAVPEDEAQAQAGIYIGLAAWEGTRRGRLLEISFALVNLALWYIVALIPFPVRVTSFYSDGRLVRRWRPKWLLWVFAWGFAEAPIEHFTKAQIEVINTNSGLVVDGRQTPVAPE